MEKVKITREQADAIEYFKEHLEPKLKGMLNRDLIAALNFGYEVEPEFKVGDWVVYIHTGSVFKIIDVRKKNGVTYITVDNEMYKQVSPKHFRHATPEEIQQEKERRWWKSHGREVWELRNGDILNDLQTYEFHEVQNVDDRFITLKNVDGLVVNPKLKYKIVCFAENRLDVNAE